MPSNDLWQSQGTARNIIIRIYIRGYMQSNLQKRLIKKIIIIGNEEDEINIVKYV